MYLLMSMDFWTDFIGANIGLTGCTRAADAQDLVDWGGAEVSACVGMSQQTLVSQWDLPTEAQGSASDYPTSGSDLFVSGQLRAQAEEGDEHMLCSGLSKVGRLENYTGRGVFREVRKGRGMQPAL